MTTARHNFISNQKERPATGRPEVVSVVKRLFMRAKSAAASKQLKHSRQKVAPDPGFISERVTL
jgi:hypothetical protein